MLLFTIRTHGPPGKDHLKGSEVEEPILGPKSRVDASREGKQGEGGCKSMNFTHHILVNSRTQSLYLYHKPNTKEMKNDFQH